MEEWNQALRKQLTGIKYNLQSQSSLTYFLQLVPTLLGF